MKVNMLLKLKDVPGSLIGALNPISSHGGNIIGVLHLRGGIGHVPVQVTFGIIDESSLNLINESLKKENVRVSRIEVEGHIYYEKKTHLFCLIGHVIDKDILDTIDKINEFGMVSDLDVVMPSPEKKSSVMMNVDVDKEKVGELMETINAICAEKDFLLIKSL